MTKGYVVVCADRWGNKRHLAQQSGRTLCGRRWRKTWGSLFPHDEVQHFEAKKDCQICRRMQEDKA